MLKKEGSRNMNNSTGRECVLNIYIIRIILYSSECWKIRDKGDVICENTTGVFVSSDQLLWGIKSRALLVRM